jgi:type II secretory pathway pseudopilin PulG
MKLQIVRRRPRKSRDQGYVLLVLLLTLSLMAIAAAAVSSTIAFQMKRDREEELIHRGVQYSRAVRRYAKATGRYPLDLQDLNGKNGMRYIRRLYKDPVTGKDFRLLYTRDIMNATAANVPQNGQPIQSDSSAGGGNQQDSTDAPAGQQNTGNAVLNSGNQPSFPQAGGAITAAGSAATNSSAASNGSSLGVFFGVVSTSKGKTIREFEHKNHYNQWLFFYDPGHETGFLVTGPTSLTLPATSLVGQPAAGAPSSSIPSSTIGQPGTAQPQPPPPPSTN